jgi:hypothetical protein
MLNEMLNERPIRIPRAFYTFAAVLLLGMMFAQVITSIPQLSITFDEDLHISTGYSVLRTGDLRLVEDHPPLIGLWMSWPLLLSPDTPDPADVPDWATGDRRLFVRNEIWWSIPLDSWVIPPRILVALLALVMGAVLFRWASELFGPRAGLLALALLAFDPNILAHAALATLDLGVACLMFITMYGVYRVGRRPTRMNLVGTGILLGLALSAKISAVILLPVSSGILVLWGLRRRQSKLLLWMFVYLGIAFLTLWAVHLFDFGTPQGLSFSVPAPTYLRSFLRVGKHVATGNRAYLLGETYEGGRWYYFPVVFALKTPLPALVLLGIALVVVWLPPRRVWRELVLLSLPLSYFVVSMFNAINLGYRHLLPVLPFIYLFVARLVSPDYEFHVPALYIPHVTRRFNHRFRALLSGGLVLLVLWQAIGTLRTWPAYLTFFNELAGGSRNGYRYLADSNVDWGQGLKALRTYLEQQNWTHPELSSFTFFIRPELYGIKAAPLPPLADAPAVLPDRFDPAPGTYIISASTLRGLQLVDPEMYNWFWHREPDDIVANAMLVYDVMQQQPEPRWLAQCLFPVAPLPPEAIAEGFSHQDLRQTFFDCTQSWLFPSGGQSPGWYVLYRDLARSDDGFIQAQLAPTRLSFEQTRRTTLPPFAIYKAPSSPMSPEHPAANSVQVGDLTFLGHTIWKQPNTKATRTIEVWTFWRVDGLPIRPLSLMLHMAGPEGAPTVVGDGLGVPVENWQVGDVIVQRHHLELPPEAPGGDYSLYTGAYWLDTLERWPVVVGEEAPSDRLFISTLSVE